MANAQRSKKLQVAVTGANGALGKLALQRLAASDKIAQLVALDLAEPAMRDPKLVFEPIDLVTPQATTRMAEAMRRFAVDAVVHLAFFSTPVRDVTYSHELEVIGTSRVLAACAQAEVRALVMASTTLVYGASQKNPNFLTEDRPLPTKLRGRFIADKLAAEEQVNAFRGSYPALRSTVLRFAPIIGPSIDNAFTRYLDSKVAMVLLGHDPLVQCVHENDAVEAIHQALVRERSGAFNIVADGVIPLSSLLHIAGTKRLPLPTFASKSILQAMNASGILSIPLSALDYLRYLWVADSSKAKKLLGFKPLFSTRETILSFARSRRTRAA